jgi:hypothetical protein
MNANGELMTTTTTNPLDEFLASLGMRPFTGGPCDCAPGECPAEGMDPMAAMLAGNGGGFVIVDDVDGDDDSEDFDLKPAVEQLGNILEAVSMATAMHAGLLKQIADGEI